MRTSKFFLIILSALFFSCASTKFEGKAVLTGRVCDTEGKPVPNYHINAGIGLNAITDAGGVFVIRDLPAGNYVISGSGDGWCSTEQEVSFYDRKSIVCIEVKSLESILPQIESFIKEKNYSAAKKLLYKSKKLNESNAIFNCYKQLIAYCSSPSSKHEKAFLASLEGF